jgi:cysteine desulfurase
MPMVYLDNAATTRVAPEVVRVIEECLREDFGNPSSAHRVGIAAEARVKAARLTLLAALGDEGGAAGDVIWTSGGTEADALGVLGAARAHARRGKHLVVSAIEHPAVLGAAKQLEAEGFTTTVVPVTKDGVVTPEAVQAAMTDETVVVAVMMVNNELGTIQDVATIARAAKAPRAHVHVHCDAVQGLGKVPLDVTALGADSVAVSAHKLHGPKGAGALWLKKGARLQALWSGGGQQGGLRSGTLAVPMIAALAEAARLATAALASERVRVEGLRARLVEEVVAAGLGAQVSCAGAPRVPHIVSLALPRLPAEPLLHALEARGVYVSAGSACASQHKGPSHVLQAIGVADDVATLRVSFSRETTEDDVATAARALVEEARALGR